MNSEGTAAGIVRTQVITKTTFLPRFSVVIGDLSCADYLPQRLYQRFYTKETIGIDPAMAEEGGINVGRVFPFARSPCTAVYVSCRL